MHRALVILLALATAALGQGSLSNVAIFTPRSEPGTVQTALIPLDNSTFTITANFNYPGGTDSAGMWAGSGCFFNAWEVDSLQSPSNDPIANGGCKGGSYLSYSGDSGSDDLWKATFTGPYIFSDPSQCLRTGLAWVTVYCTTPSGMTFYWSQNANSGSTQDIFKLFTKLDCQNDPSSCSSHQGCFFCSHLNECMVEANSALICLIKSGIDAWLRIVIIVAVIICVAMLIGGIVICLCCCGVCAAGCACASGMDCGCCPRKQKKWEDKPSKVEMGNATSYNQPSFASQPQFVPVTQTTPQWQQPGAYGVYPAQPYAAPQQLYTPIAAPSLATPIAVPSVQQPQVYNPQVVMAIEPSAPPAPAMASVGSAVERDRTRRDSNVAAVVVQDHEIVQDKPRKALMERMFDDSVTMPTILPRLSMFQEDYKPSALMESLKAVEPPLKHLDIIYNTCSDCLERLEHPPKELTREELLAIVIYTFELPDQSLHCENIYYRLNKILRDRSDEVHSWKHYIYLLITALRKLPAYDGMVFRGIDKKADEARYARGRHVSWNSFTSTTCEEDVAKKFMKKIVGGSFFTASICRGRSLQGISLYDEKEILLEPNTEFNVVSYVVLQEMALVQMEEVEPSRPLIPL